MGNGIKYDTKVTGYDPKVARSQQESADSKCSDICFCKMCPIHTVQKVTEITKFIDFEIRSQVKGLYRHQFLCSKKVLSRSKVKILRTVLFNDTLPY